MVGGQKWGERAELERRPCSPDGNPPFSRAGHGPLSPDLARRGACGSHSPVDPHWRGSVCPLGARKGEDPQKAGSGRRPPKVGCCLTLRAAGPPFVRADSFRPLSPAGRRVWSSGPQDVYGGSRTRTSRFGVTGSENRPLLTPSARSPLPPPTSTPSRASSSCLLSARLFLRRCSRERRQMPGFGRKPRGRGG